MLDKKSVERLEDRLEEAIEAAMQSLGGKKLPLIPSRETVHLMAKAATAVYEAAVENADPEASGQ